MRSVQRSGDAEDTAASAVGMLPGEGRSGGSNECRTPMRARPDLQQRLGTTFARLSQGMTGSIEERSATSRSPRHAAGGMTTSGTSGSESSRRSRRDRRRRASSCMPPRPRAAPAGARRYRVEANWDQVEQKLEQVMGAAAETSSLPFFACSEDEDLPSPQHHPRFRLGTLRQRSKTRVQPVMQWCFPARSAPRCLRPGTIRRHRGADPFDRGGPCFR